MKDKNSEIWETENVGNGEKWEMGRNKTWKKWEMGHEKKWETRRKEKRANLKC